MVGQESEQVCGRHGGVEGQLGGATRVEGCLEPSVEPREEVVAETSRSGDGEEASAESEDTTSVESVDMGSGGEGSGEGGMAIDLCDPWDSDG